ncbi:MAG TPA: sodium:solute symporter [Ignavibacteriaceae bacterium]|nr:sodium:solute symporter [Ignavibacteriaceae bacterium]
MTLLDWIVLIGFLVFVTVYGVWKTRGTKDINGFIRAGRSTPWYTIALSIMATQASAITFLSTPGQAYVDGMRFVQFYIGLPIAMIILSITAVPIFHRLNIFTAYEYLEKRFDLKNRILGSILFLTQRGLAAGFTIFAPALILSVILGWNIDLTVIITGTLVVIYTATGGSRAVNQTHIQQMIIITVGMFTAFIMIFFLLPKDVSPLDAAFIAGKLGRLNAIDFSFNLNDRYTFWSGIIGGTFLMLSYFGTDQSQVQRYLAGSSIGQSRLGLLTNGLVKVPMQFFILFVGAMIFVFYQFVIPPIFFNPNSLTSVKQSSYADQFEGIKHQFEEIQIEKKVKLNEMLLSMNDGASVKTDQLVEQIKDKQKQADILRSKAAALITKVDPGADSNDTNYIFISYIINYLPAGIIGLILAAIFSASMSSTSAELNALASTTVIDIYKRLIRKDASEKHYLMISKVATILWGVYAITFALFANRLGSLIEAVNILGSLVYGTILGIFLVAFYLKKVKGTATFISAIIAEIVVLYCYLFTTIPFLWYNVIGCLLLVIIALVLNPVLDRKTRLNSI